MTHAPDIPFTSELLSLETLKTWSLIATVLGDLDADRISGRELWSLLEPLGVRPEAMRVALHRLKKDEWIASERTGREVEYFLSERGAAETLAAHADIYRQEVKYGGRWLLVILGPEQPDFQQPHVAIEKNVLLVPESTPLAPDVVRTCPPLEMPHWFETLLVPEHMLHQAERVAALASAFLNNPSSDRTSGRLLLLHRWRKMALRTGTWAHIELKPDGVMADCHSAMCNVFRQTPRITPLT